MKNPTSKYQLFLETRSRCSPLFGSAVLQYKSAFVMLSAIIYFIYYSHFIMPINVLFAHDLDPLQIYFSI